MVAAALSAAGWTVLGRNVRHIGFELDVVARKGTTLIVVEVKARPRPPTSAAEFEALMGPRKVASLQKGATAFLSRVENRIDTVRIDLAVVYGHARSMKIHYVVGE